MMGAAAATGRGQISAGCSAMTRKDKNMVDDIVDKLMDLDMEPTPESMWLTNTYKTANEVTLKVGRELGVAVLGG